MKTVKTANGVRRIEDWNRHLVPIQLRTILQEHRATLIDKLIVGGLEAYIDYKFCVKTIPDQGRDIRESLQQLKEEGIDMALYGSIFDEIERRECIHLANGLFYIEIDRAIRNILFQPKLFSGMQQTFFQ
jgi:hypothetical protein